MELESHRAKWPHDQKLANLLLYMTLAMSRSDPTTIPNRRMKDGEEMMKGWLLARNHQGIKVARLAEVSELSYMELINADWHSPHRLACLVQSQLTELPQQFILLGGS